MELDDMYHACLLIHGPPPQQRFGPYPHKVITSEFSNYRAAVRTWLRTNFEMRGDEGAWFEDYHYWTMEKRCGK